jgi:hypothetical protein
MLAGSASIASKNKAFRERKGAGGRLVRGPIRMINAFGARAN